MAEFSADYTIFNNSHAFMHTGPISNNVEDIQNDVYFATSGKCHTHWNKNGTKTEFVEGRWDEVSGFSISREQDIARTIVAQKGDIHINADYGDIYLKARNIYIETQGDKPNGCFLVTANGHMVLVGNDGVKMASGTNLCLIGKSKITLVGTQIITAGKIIDSGVESTGDFINKFMAGNFQDLIKGMLQSCK